MLLRTEIVLVVRVSFDSFLLMISISSIRISNPDLTGETITEAVTRALEERLSAQRRQRDRKGQLARAAALDELFDRMASYPVLDDRPADVLLGYNEDGTFEP